MRALLKTLLAAALTGAADALYSVVKGGHSIEWDHVAVLSLAGALAYLKQSPLLRDNTALFPEPNE